MEISYWDCAVTYQTGDKVLWSDGSIKICTGDSSLASPSDWKTPEELDYVKPNGCYAESGYDFFEQQVREEFEEYARRQGYDITRDNEYSFFYADGRTEDAWRMYHVGHVRGREFQIKRTLG